MDKYINRLTEEWKQHGNIIVAIDYDDTISPWKLNGGEECQKIIDLLKQVKLVGAYLVVFTACREDRYEEIRKYCLSNSLDIDCINETPVQLPYGNDKKIYANIFLDDRAGLNESLTILTESMFRVRAYKAGKKLDYEGSLGF